MSHNIATATNGRSRFRVESVSAPNMTTPISAASELTPSNQ